MARATFNDVDFAAVRRGRGKKHALIELSAQTKSAAQSVSQAAQAASAFDLRFLMIGPGIEWATDHGDYIPWIDS